MSFKEFIAELHRRNVLRVVSVFSLSAWLIIQVLDTTDEHLGIPGWFIKGVIILTILLIPVMAVVSWKYELIPDKKLPEKRHPGRPEIVPDSEQQSIPQPLNFWIFFSLLIVGLALLTFVSVRLFNKQPTYELKYLKTQPLAILAFDNNTRDSLYNGIGDIVSAKLTEALEATKEVNLVIHNTRMDGSSYLSKLHSQLGSSPEFEQKTGVKNLLTGSYHIEGEDIVFNSYLTNVSTGKLIKSFEEQRSGIDNPFEAIDNLVQYVLGFWLASDQPVYSGELIKGEALREYQKAIKLWEEDYERAIVHLNRSIEIDSNFFDAYLLMSGAYLNMDEYEKADSILEKVRAKSTQLNEYEIDLYSYYHSRLQRNLRDAYYYYLKIFERAPKDLFINTTAISLAVLANDAGKAISIADEIDPDWIDQKLCYYCRDRASFLAQALIDRKKYQQAIQLMQSARYDPIDMSLTELEVRGMVRLGLDHSFGELLQKSINQDYTYGGYGYLLQRVAKEYDMIDNARTADYVNQAIEYHESQPGPKNLKVRAEMHMITGEYNISEQLMEAYFEQVDTTNQPREDFLMEELLLARARAVQGKKDEVADFLSHLESLKNPDDQGGYSYLLANIWISLGDLEKSLDYLQESVVRGRRFYRFDFHNDYELKSLFDHPRFKRVLNYYIE